jgi:2,3-bisphosphoglycerate-independent phosphoglycerate mutase
MRQKTALIILDGWGKGPAGKANAILTAHTPVMDQLMAQYPNAELLTHGEYVGLPDGQMGNSEVGHLNIGAGRVVYQDLVRINKAIQSGELEQHPEITAAINLCRQTDCRLHLMGLVSTGGVHSHQSHLEALCRISDKAGLSDTVVHAFMDGRDRDPHSGLGHIRDLQQFLASTSSRVQIASVVGRYYAMDRDKRWDRVRKAYDLLVNGTGTTYSTAEKAVEASYAAGITDEFMEPAVIGAGARIQPGDVVLCFNFRTDRCREITTVLTQQNMPEMGMKTLPLHYITLTRYDESFRDVHVIFDKDNLPMTLGEVVSKAGLTQLRMAETEKYPHVTFFFSGGREQEFPGETRVVIPSPKVGTYDQQPEMSAREVTAAAIAQMAGHQPDFICLNFANPDMVGHTGVYDAIVQAVQVVDECLGQVVAAGLQHAYSFVIIADHGNADFAINHDGSPNTAHTINPVPVVVIDPDVKQVSNGILADVAPTICQLMGLPQPPEMTGRALV